MLDEEVLVASGLPVVKLAVRCEWHWQSLATVGSFVGSMPAVAVAADWQCFQIEGLDRKACLSAP